MAQTKWQWRTGFWVAVLFGFLSAGAGGLTGNWKTFLSVLCVSLTGQLTSYLTKSPIDDVLDPTADGPALPSEHAASPMTLTQPLPENNNKPNNK